MCAASMPRPPMLASSPIYLRDPYRTFDSFGDLRGSRRHLSLIIMLVGMLVMSIINFNYC